MARHRLIKPIAVFNLWASNLAVFTPTGVGNELLQPARSRCYGDVFYPLWQADHPAQPNVQIYLDVAGLTPARDVVIEPSFTESNNPALAEAAEQAGVMRVRISGLTPLHHILSPGNTHKLGTRGVSLRRCPALDRHVQNSIPFGNDSVAVDILKPDGSTAATGSIVLLEVEGSAAPISYLVGMWAMQMDKPLSEHY